MQRSYKDLLDIILRIEYGFIYFGEYVIIFYNLCSVDIFSKKTVFSGRELYMLLIEKSEVKKLPGVLSNFYVVLLQLNKSEVFKFKTKINSRQV